MTYRLFWLVLGLALLLGNLVILGVAWDDRGWTALGIAVLFGPAMNGVFLISGLLAIPFFKQLGVQFQLGRHLALAIGIPVAVAVVDFLLITSMDLHGG